MPDESTYGFNKDDATALIESIQNGENWYPEIKPRGGGGGGVIEYKIVSTSTKASGPYTGLVAAQVIIHGAPCGRSSLIGQEAEIIDHSGGIFDLPDLEDYTGWASEMIFLSLDPEVECDTISPCHWAAINRVCDPDTGIYAAACQSASAYVSPGYNPAGYMPVGYV